MQLRHLQRQHTHELPSTSLASHSIPLIRLPQRSGSKGWIIEVRILSQPHALDVMSGGCSFYPLYPPALGTFLDSSLGAALGMAVTPDVLLLPSDLAPFAKMLPSAGASVAQACTVLPLLIILY